MIGPIIFVQVRQMLLRQPAICAKSYRGCALQCAAPQQPAKLRSGTTRALGFAEADSTFAAKQIIHHLQMTGSTPPAVMLPNFAVQSVVFDDLGPLGNGRP
jgi:hypothetical protein